MRSTGARVGAEARCCGAAPTRSSSSCNGHYVFFSVRDDRDNGTVIDLLQRRQNLSLGAVRQILRPWIGRSRSSRSSPNWSRPGRTGCVSKARTGAWQTHSGFRISNTSAVCPQQRCYRRGWRAACGSTPSATRYFHIPMPRGCADTRSRIVDSPALPPAEKGLWMSHTQPADRRLILTESAVDALSHAALFPDAEDQTRYASLGGKPSSRQRELVQATIAKLPAGAEIVAAFDADGAGRQLVEVIREAVASIARRTERSDLIFKAHLPTQKGRLEYGPAESRTGMTAGILRADDQGPDWVKLDLPDRQPVR